ncbi:hypothetical protein CALCODRAFT_495873 [Calocera cornea HHB12733]|uniref:DUF7918 domain-containing protein n=1 Tax=Calocera cornea HHB12733 TaxID=1353952 RepID=A0A165G5T6_9BASI|nr:hypothetical protein CALCODRAFT_495873 [Calocera cornea HHB12733]
MPRLGDYETWVEVDGERLEEYAVVSKAGKLRVKCWIPSEEGKNFVIHCKDYAKDRTSSWSIFADGQGLESVFTQPDERCVSEAGMAISDTEMRLFQFGRVRLTEDEQLALKDASLVKKLGTLKILVKQGRIIPSADDDRDSHKILKCEPIHEQAKKATDHCIIGGDIVEEEADWIDFKSDGGKRTSFLFQYRPRELLQAKEIMPRAAPSHHAINDSEDKQYIRSTSNDRHVQGRDQVDTETKEATKVRILLLEEELEALRKLGKTLGKGPAVRSEDGERPSKRMKIEPKPVFKWDEVIDLT